MDLGTNMKVSLKGNKLTIIVDISKRHGTSKSGKSEIVATSSGNKRIKDDLWIGLNIYERK